MQPIAVDDALSNDPRRNVFVVHGRNGQARDSVFALLRFLDLVPIEWSKAVALTGKGSPYIGEILDAAFRNAQAIVVLMTPDEVAYLRHEYVDPATPSEGDVAAQARPNVLFEAGMALGRSADRTILVELGSLRPFSDIAGRHVLRMDNSPERRHDFANRLRQAGCGVDSSGTDWLTVGDFTPPPPPGNGLPLGKRVPEPQGLSRVQLDARYHKGAGAGTGKLEIINRGTETVFDLQVEIPPEIENFRLHPTELPIRKIPPGRSVMLMASRFLGAGASYFDVSFAGRTESGDEFRQEAFLSLG